LFIAIAGDQNVIAIIADKSLVSAAATNQQIMPTTALEFLQSAFTGHQGIGPTREITVARAVITVKILIARQSQAYMDAGFQTIITGTSEKLLPFAGTTQQRVSAFPAA
jgi:hypothetical protein